MFHKIETDKFKTNLLGVYFHLPIDDETTKTSLLSQVMTRGIKGEMTSRELFLRLQDLYGAQIDSGVEKKGDELVLYVSAEYLSPKYADITEDVLQTLSRLIFRHEAFDADYVFQEKENLKNHIKSQINDKRVYSYNRLIEILCEGEPFGRNELGELDRVDEITPDALFAHYKNNVLTAPFEVIFCGSGLMTPITNTFASHENEGRPIESDVRVSVAQVREVVETADVSQGKLNMGFRTRTLPTDDDYPSLIVYNTIFGGSPYSKLFNNVREAKSLCYHVSSKLDRFKGIMIVSSGIETEQYDAAREAIMEQFSDMAAGEITGAELSNAKASIINSLRALSDSAAGMSSFLLGAVILGDADKIPDIIEKIEKVSIDDVVKVAKKIELDTIYFLKNEV